MNYVINAVNDAAAQAAASRPFSANPGGGRTDSGTTGGAAGNTGRGLPAEMPYERFEAYGKEALSNSELLAILLRSGTRQEPVTELARHLLQLGNGDGSSLSVLHTLSKEELQRIPGIGSVKATQIQCLLELSRRLARESACIHGARLVCSNPQVVAGYYMESLRHEEQERVVALFLDNRLTLIREETMAIGTNDAALCSTRDIYRQALQAGAAALLVLHNHPSGKPDPSQQDILLTRKLASAGNLMEIRLVDHIIIGDRCYCSLKENGLLQLPQEGTA